MPLSDYEKRQLEAIEHQLSADSPRLSSQLSRGRPANFLRRCGGQLAEIAPTLARPALRVPVAVLVGVFLVLIGTWLRAAGGIVLAVTGYLLVVAALDECVLRWRRRRAARRPT